MKPLVELKVPLPDILEESGGEYRVKGHRITLYHIVTAFRNGIAPHAMVFYFSSLSLDQIEKVEAFYKANRLAIDQFMADYQATLDEQRAAGKTLDMGELRRRFDAMRSNPARTDPNVAERPVEPTPAVGG